MGNIVKFRLRASPTREQAKRWLTSNINTFPENMPGDIGPPLFHGWRFVRADDNNVYFANCLQPGIGADEIAQARVAPNKESCIRLDYTALEIEE